ncbi:putative AlkP superfamily pyrophosphatase or phosphodiesterase [Promicromonospora sp. AC04]|uniref:alkaline phosphatase family protein n=1 Tax=Promicromonospora sp. AC04 TaxID=2135723 RepID=UPI000D343FC5|nr:alkaline phosphatase family protein [Promicromonospora sp. AC04]PUB27197.1 putative AlkP superfamily pyrophosphatase or phosphodiesterase [Promicromonospora sp. AC04]
MMPSLRKFLATSIAAAAVWTASTADAAPLPPVTDARPVTTEPTTHHPRADHVVFLALDGFDVEYLDLVRDGVAEMPNLGRLLRQGSVTTSTGVMTSITNPSWSSVATGAWPETHHNTAYWFDPATNTARGQQRDIAVPTIAQSVREQGGTVFSAQWFILQNYGVTFGDPDGLYTQPGGDCARRTDDAVAVLRGEPVSSGGQLVTANGIPELMTVYCDTLDAIGHDGGDADPRIPGALEDIDRQIGRIVAATKEAGVHRRTAFVITGDHGMTTFDRGFGAEGLAAIEAAGFTPQVLTSGQSPAPGTDVAIVVGGVADVRIIGERVGDPAAVGRLEQALKALPQVRNVFDRADQRRMQMSPNHGDLLVEPEPGWSFGSTPADPAGRHGATTELHIPLVLAGAGVRPGVHPYDPRHIDIAPTISALLGYAPPSGSEGRVLHEALRR